MARGESEDGFEDAAGRWRGDANDVVVRVAAPCLVAKLVGRVQRARLVLANAIEGRLLLVLVEGENLSERKSWSVAVVEGWRGRNDAAAITSFFGLYIHSSSNGVHGKVEEAPLGRILNKTLVVAHTIESL
jgi:hypothetical protein